MLRLEAQGKSPAALQRMPSLFEDLNPLWHAFQDLHVCRPYYEGWPGAIPMSELLAYVQFFGIKEEQRMDFFRLIRALDLYFLQFMEKRQKDGK